MSARRDHFRGNGQIHRKTPRIDKTGNRLYGIAPNEPVAGKTRSVPSGNKIFEMTDEDDYDYSDELRDQEDRDMEERIREHFEDPYPYD